MKKSFLFIIILLGACTYSTSGQVSKEGEVLKYAMSTPWSEKVDEDNVWTGYPRPQMRRDNWINLNGMWDYAIKPMSDQMPSQYDGEILVPFAVESALSKVKKLVGEKNHLWYRTGFTVPKLNAGERWQLHFGAVDWEATIYLNGELVGGHKGGYTPFSFDITPFLKKRGQQELIVRVWDPTDAGTQARGKQVRDPRGIWYTPVTGIWQTVWLEKTPVDHIRHLKTTPDIDRSEVLVSIFTQAVGKATSCKVTIRNGKQVIASQEQTIAAGADMTALEIKTPDMRLWSPDDPFLYDLEVSLVSASGQIVDKVDSYFGMRKISMGKDANGYTVMLLNNEPLFQFGLLDQGWWPDGLYTAPTEEAMVYDIKMTQEFGFNMLRKHVKVEPARFYYHCDKMGMLVWQDMPNGNYFQDLRIQAWDKEDVDRPLESALQFEKEYKELIDYFYSHPSIVVWVPFNEGWGQYDTERIAAWTKSYDPSRLCDAPSGWTDRGVGDIIDVHLYPGPGMEAPEEDRVSVLGEFGGLGLPVKDHMWWNKRNWGYLTFQDQEVYQKEFEKLINSLIGLKSWGLAGAIYTQTTDVEGEVNGLMTYDRKINKMDPGFTKELIKPLYRPAWNKRVLLSDSEHRPADWLVSFEETNKNWMKPEFNDQDWESVKGPFSSYQNVFLPDAYSHWNPEKELKARKKVYLTHVPDQVNLKYYFPKSTIEVFINGKKVMEREDRGGRKRHYGHLLIEDAATYLKKGANVIAVRAKSLDKECSFDLGLYSAALVEDTEDSSSMNVKDSNR